MFGGSRQMKGALEAFFKATNGDIATTLLLSPGSAMSAEQLYGVSDTAAASRAITAWLDAFNAGLTFGPPEMTGTMRTLPDAPVHDGVTLRGYRTSHDLSKATPAQREAMERMVGARGADTRMAVFDGVGTIVTGPDSVAAAGRLIDAVRGKAPRFAAPPAIAQFLTESRARKDSMAMTLDIARIIASMAGGATRAGDGAPVMLSLGFADRRAHVRIAAPVASVRAVIPAARP
jgi:hypothetical protein